MIKEILNRTMMKTLTSKNGVSPKVWEVDVGVGWVKAVLETKHITCHHTQPNHTVLSENS